MLVLSRRSGDYVSFPQLGISIRFLNVKSGNAKIGIEAPRDVAVVRNEIDDDETVSSLIQKQLKQLPRDVRHGIRNELHAISVGLHLYHEEVAAGQFENAENTFSEVIATLRKLYDHEILRRAESDESNAQKDRVFLVEDESNEREMLAGFLRLKGFDVTSFSDGLETWESLSEQDPPGFLLVDMKMPNWDGPTLIRKIRSDESFRSTKVFAISGVSPEEYGIAIGPGGVDRWFPKPLNPHFLLSAIDPSAQTTNPA